jgi:hypothetical protein
MEDCKREFLTGLLPEGFKEDFISETDKHYAVRVLGKRLDDKGWDNLFNSLKAEFGDNLIEVFSNTSYGVDFVVYLRKS